MKRLHLHGVGSCSLGRDEPTVPGLGRVEDVPIAEYARASARRRYARVARLVYVAAKRALADAGIEDPSDLCTVTSTALGETAATVSLLTQIRETRGDTVSPALVPNTVHNAPAGHLTIGLGMREACATVSQGWLSAEAAIAAAADLLDHGPARRALAICADEADPGWVGGLEELGAREWARGLEALALQEGAIALVVGSEPGGRRLGSVAAALERAPEGADGVRRVLERHLSGADLPPEIRVRAAADGRALLEDLSSLPELRDRSVSLDGEGLGTSQAGAFAALVDRVEDPSCRGLLMVGREIDEVGLLCWTP